MPSTFFIVLAALMVVTAMMMIVVPLLRRGDPSPIAAASIIAVVPLAAAALYLVYSNWDWDATQPVAAAHSASGEAGSLAEIVGGLEQKLEANPDDAQGWQMLGRTYVVLSRYPDAVEAYGRARQLTADQDIHALTGYAEALAMQRGGIMDEETAGLFEKALEISPADRKALWYGGLAAFEQGRAEVARNRWQQLLAQGPSEEMAAILNEQIAAADAILGDAAAATLEPVTPSVETGVAGLLLRVSIAPALAGRAHPEAPVFILAKQVGAAGPPLAVVRRRVADLPFELLLSDADSMVDGRVLSAFENVEVVARIALSGTPTAQAGDLSGSKIVASRGNVAILIDTVVGD